MSYCTPPAEIEISPELVAGLLIQQAPEYSSMAVTFFGSGWDNDMYRLGSDYAVRLPRRQVGARLILNEQLWLPQIAGTLPFATPVPLFVGKPANGFPWSWSIVPWFEGCSLAAVGTFTSIHILEDIAKFLNALHVPADPAAPRNATRGVPLGERDEVTRGYLHRLSGASEWLVLWEELSNAPAWNGPQLWLHGDLHPLNVLVRNGRLEAIIDFGDITAGDPATDFALAWMVFDATEREAFREQLLVEGRAIDAATWQRARGWALSMAAAIVAHSVDDPILKRLASMTLERVR